jgi:RNA polymerase sigma-70 factor (ECF subfamily)
MVDRDEVESLIPRCRDTWPGIDLSPDAFATWLDVRVPDGTTLASLVVTDLYVACACATGDPLALERVDDHIVREVGVAAARMRAAAGVVDEAQQVVREILFVRRAERPPAIDSYAGRGDLRGWIKVIATREVLRLADRDRDRREIATDDDELLEVLSPKNDPELEQMKATYRDEFAEAFRGALAGLTPRERTLLRHQVVDGLGIEAIGALYRVHRATAARWLQAARDTLADATRRRLADKLRLTELEVDSLIRLIHSRIEVSIERHLKK